MPYKDKKAWNKYMRDYRAYERRIIQQAKKEEQLQPQILQSAREFSKMPKRKK